MQLCSPPLLPSPGWPLSRWLGAEGLPEHFERSSCAATCSWRGGCRWAPAAGVSRPQLQRMGPSGGGDRGASWERPRASLHRGSESKLVEVAQPQRETVTVICSPFICPNRLTHMRSTGPSTRRTGASLFLRTTWKRPFLRSKKCATSCVTRASSWGGPNPWTGPLNTELQTSHQQVWRRQQPRYIT